MINTTSERWPLLLLPILFLFIGLPVTAGDLWKEATEENETNKQQLPSSYGQLPREPIQKHDLVTILIQEQATAESRARTRREKETSWEAQLAEWIRFKSTNDKTGLQLEEALPNLNPGIDLESEYEDEARGRTQRDMTLTDRVTAEVKQVLPNGNLVLEARKVRKINGERETLRVTGVARPEDINRENEIVSEKLANVFISTDGKGTVSGIQGRGILSTLLDTIWPF